MQVRSPLVSGRRRTSISPNSFRQLTGGWSLEGKDPSQRPAEGESLHQFGAKSLSHVRRLIAQQRRIKEVSKPMGAYCACPSCAGPCGVRKEKVICFDCGRIIEGCCE